MGYGGLNGANKNRDARAAPGFIPRAYTPQAQEWRPVIWMAYNPPQKRAIASKFPAKAGIYEFYR
jgi:hypothetical protein